MGLRIGEICALKVSDVDLKRNELTGGRSVDGGNSISEQRTIR